MLHAVSRYFMRVTFFCLMPFIFASCALGRNDRSEFALSDPEVFRVGEIEVRLYKDREKMVRDLPPFFGLLEATPVANKQIVTRGFYDAQNKRIYSIDDARVVIHEFKHYFEPDWKHGIETPRSEPKPVNTTRPIEHDATHSRLLMSIHASEPLSPE